MGALSLFLLPAAQSIGQTTTTATTDPVGYSMVGAYNSGGTYTGITANSDSVISLPFTLPPAYVGSIGSVSQGTSVITVASTPNWSTNQYGKYGLAGAPALPTGYTNPAPSRYYALIGPNAATTTTPKEGCYYPIVSNDANSLTLNLNSDDISGVTAGTQVLIIPYSTLGAIFPDSDVQAGTSFLASTNSASPLMSILIPNLAFIGINPGTAATYYYINTVSKGVPNIGWRLFGDKGTVDHSIDPLPVGSYFTIRNSTSTVTSLTVTGSVLTKKLTTPLANETNKQQDNVVAVDRPVAQTLNQSGLIASGVFASSTSSANPVDQLFVFDNSKPQTNRSASATYYYINTTTKGGLPNVGWRQFGQSSTGDVGDVAVLQPGTGYVIRKGVGNGSTQFWTNAPNY